MTQIINSNGGYLERVTVNKIEALPGQYHIKVETQYADSRHPDEWRTVYKTTCEQGGLQAFGSEIKEAQDGRD
jgi:hypothetical protein